MTRFAARLVVAVAVLALLAGAANATLAYGPEDRPSLDRGRIVDPANGTTAVAVQGFHVDGWGNYRKPPRLASAGPNGTTRWVVNGTADDITWFYDVDPLANGNLLVTSTRPGTTIVFELDPETGERVWVERLSITDTHDVDMLPNGNLVVANMRNYDPEREISNDRVFVYDRARDEVVWEWTVRNHFPNDTDGGFSEDWTHVNDVDPVAGGFLISLRNFDQVVLVNRTTKRVEWRLGRDGAHGVLFEQHNPDYLRGPDGRPTVLVADSENDRVVEFTRRNGTWARTWTLRGNLSWPRDADRLPNGNTLVTDTLNHRIVEVTPQGRVVWEYFAPWGPYDAERVAHGGGSNGPTMAELNASGTYEIRGGQESGITDRVTPALWVRRRTAGTPLAGVVDPAVTRWTHVVPWLRPVWMPPWAFVYALLAGVLLVGWAGVEAWFGRRRIATAVRSGLARVRRGD